MDTHFLADYVADPQATFTAEPWYNSYGDCIEYRCADEATVADRIDGVLTLYRSANDDRVIGFQLKGVKAMMDKFGFDAATMAAETAGGRVVSVRLLLLAAGKESERTESFTGLQAYDEALETAGDKTVEVAEAVGS
jgi:hypothetical protein